MTRSIRLDDEAAEEVEAAVSWYETQRPGLGLELLASLEEARIGLVDSPGVFPLVPEVSIRLGVRRCPVPRFPFSLVFVELADEMRVLAVAHSRRRPGYWRSRL